MKLPKKYLTKNPNVMRRETNRQRRGEHRNREPQSRDDS